MATFQKVKLPRSYADISEGSFLKSEASSYSRSSITEEIHIGTTRPEGFYASTCVSVNAACQIRHSTYVYNFLPGLQTTTAT